MASPRRIADSTFLDTTPFDRSSATAVRLDRLPQCYRVGVAAGRGDSDSSTHLHHPVLHLKLADQCIAEPPSTRRVWPVMKSLSCEARKTSAPTRSSGVSSRFSARLSTLIGRSAP